MTKLTKADLLKLVAEKASVSVKDVTSVLDAYHEVVLEQTMNDVVVFYPGFGTYQVSATKARMGINPKTMEKIEIAAGRRISFKPAKQVKDRLKKSCC